MASKTQLARHLGISRQSIYYQPRRPARDIALRERILAALDHNPAYGHRRLALHLTRTSKHRVNKKSVLRVMRKYGIRPKLTRRRFRYQKSQEYAMERIPNRTAELTQKHPDTVWAGDFTYLWFHGRHVYLATVIDTFTREILAWQIGLHHTSRLVVDVLQEALHRRGKAPKFFHSDQGSEYASQSCVQWLVKHRITPSWSPKGKPWMNGRQESFFSSFKLEFGKPFRFKTIEDLMEGIGKYLHYYNAERIHSALKMPPRIFYETKAWRKRNSKKQWVKKRIFTIN